MIDVKGLTKSYVIGDQIIKAVDDISIEIGKGDFVSIVGHSGSGKTTFLSLLGGLTRPDSGTVIVDGINLWSIADNRLSEFRNRKINFIFQFASLLPVLTAKENILLPGIFSSEERLAFEDKAEDYLRMIGIGDKINSYPSELSGGQQRRVAIVRALMNDPEIILADEPTGDLDEETEAEIMGLFKRINKEKGITFILVTHSSELAKDAKRRMRMSHGKLLEEEE